MTKTYTNRCSRIWDLSIWWSSFRYRLLQQIQFSNNNHVYKNIAFIVLAPVLQRCSTFLLFFTYLYFFLEVTHLHHCINQSIMSSIPFSNSNQLTRLFMNVNLWYASLVLSYPYWQQCYWNLSKQNNVLRWVARLIFPAIIRVITTTLIWTVIWFIPGWLWQNTPNYSKIRPYSTDRVYSVLDWRLLICTHPYCREW